jgi:hypothetical protein
MESIILHLSPHSFLKNSSPLHASQFHDIPWDISCKVFHSSWKLRKQLQCTKKHHLLCFKFQAEAVWFLMSPLIHIPQRASTQLCPWLPMPIWIYTLQCRLAVFDIRNTHFCEGDLLEFKGTHHFNMTNFQPLNSFLCFYHAFVNTEVLPFLSHSPFHNHSLPII